MESMLALDDLQMNIAQQQFTTQIRFLPPQAKAALALGSWPSGDTLLAIFEWSDVFAIILWTVFRIWKTCPNMVVSIVVDRENDDEEEDEATRPLTVAAVASTRSSSSTMTTYQTAAAFTLPCLLSISFGIAIFVLVVTFVCMDYSKGLQFISDGWEQ